MKYLIIILSIITTLGVSPSSNVEDFNTYSALLPTFTVKANILEGFEAKRAKTRDEVAKLNNSLFTYVARYTVLTKAQAYSLFIQEQGLGSYLYTKHNNPFNVKASKAQRSTLALTWEYTRDNDVYDSFRSHTTIQDGAEAFVIYFNRRFCHVKAGTNREVFYNMRYGKDKYGNTIAYHTDQSHWARAKLADKYEKLNV
jgi:hypothetical protein